MDRNIFREWLREELKDPEFKRYYEEEKMKLERENFPTMDNTLLKPKSDPIDAGEGYRLLNDKEHIAIDDEWRLNLTCWRKIVTGDGWVHELAGNQGNVYFRRKIEHRYIESMDDIKPWQFYKHGDCLCKIFKDSDSEGIYHIFYLDEDDEVSVCSDYDFSNDIIKQFRMAKINEIPKSTLIGKRVKGWDEHKEGAVEGILVNIYEGRDKNYNISDTENYHADFKYIELVDNIVNYS